MDEVTRKRRILEERLRFHGQVSMDGIILRNDDFVLPANEARRGTPVPKSLVERLQHDVIWGKITTERYTSYRNTAQTAAGAIDIEGRLRKRYDLPPNKNPRTSQHRPKKRRPSGILIVYETFNDADIARMRSFARQRGYTARKWEWGRKSLGLIVRVSKTDLKEFHRQGWIKREHVPPTRIHLAVDGPRRQKVIVGHPGLGKKR